MHVVVYMLGEARLKELDFCFIDRIFQTACFHFQPYKEKAFRMRSNQCVGQTQSYTFDYYFLEGKPPHIQNNTGIHSVIEAIRISTHMIHSDFF